MSNVIAEIFKQIENIIKNGGDLLSFLEDQKVTTLRGLANEMDLRTSAWRTMEAKKQDLVDEIFLALDDESNIPEIKPQSVKEEAKPMPATQNPAQGDLAQVLAQAISAHMPANEAKLDEARVNELINENLSERLDAATANMVSKLKEILDAKQEESKARLVIEIPGKPEVELDGHQHENFETLLDFVAAGLHVMMVGPAGSGKTHGASNVAKALAKPFYCMSVGAQTTLSQIMGYMDATGSYVRTVFRDAYENGGVFLLDEIDAGNPNVLTALNAALANEVCGFPDGMVSKHADFVCIAAANTYGNGQDRQYVGRNQLDATSLDRFATLDWDYDLAMEAKITGLPAWVEVVQAYRKSAQGLGVRHIISPRASMAGARLLLQGKIGIEKILDAVVWKSLDKASVKQIKANAGVTSEHLKAAMKEAESLKADTPSFDEFAGQGAA